jgi:peptidylamidoglycolate lyase
LRIAVAAIMLLAGCSTAPPARESAPRAAVVAGWPSIPKRAKFGQVSAVDIDASGRVYVLHRAGREWSEPFPAAPIAEPTVFVFEGESGRLLARWGAGQFVMPHGLSIDPYGKVWITDVGREQVFRFSADGKLELALGQRGVTGADARHFGRPTDVAFAGEEVFISDGYLNHRVAVYDRDGTFLREWGEAGVGARGLRIPHAITFRMGSIYVADRENGRIQVTDPMGKLRGNWRHDPANGHPYSIKPLGYSRLVSVEGRDAVDRSGAVLRIWHPDGTLERSFDVSLRGEQASLGHDIAIGGDGMAYVADVYGNRVVKVDLRGIGVN